MKVLTVSALRAQLKHYLDTVSDSFDTLVISRGKQSSKAVVIISLEEYKALVETNWLLANKTNREWLRESIAQEANGEIQPFDVDAFEAED